MTTPVSKPPTRSPYQYTKPKDDTPKVIRWARIILTLITIPVGLAAFKDEYGQVVLISDINTAIHEFGHMLFMPFGFAILGDTMVILGGSLLEVMFPGIFVAYFLFGKKEHRDLHGAMIALWWMAIALMQVSIYMADARALRLMMITGELADENPDIHDWRNLFLSWGLLSKDTVVAGWTKFVAGAMFFVSVFVGGTAAWLSGRKEEQDAQRTKA